MGGGHRKEEMSTWGSVDPTLLCTCMLRSATLRASLPLCSHMVGVGSCRGDQVGLGRVLHSSEGTRGPARGAATLALCEWEPL